MFFCFFSGIAAAGTGKAVLTERQPIQQFGQTEE